MHQTLTHNKSFGQAKCFSETAEEEEEEAVIPPCVSLCHPDVAHNGSGGNFTQTRKTGSQRERAWMPGWNTDELKAPLPFGLKILSEWTAWNQNHPIH